VGLLGLLLGIANVILTFVVGALDRPGAPAAGQMGQMRPGQRPVQQESTYQATLRVSGYAGVMVSLLWGLIVPLGAYYMLRLERYSTAIVAIIFAMLPCSLAWLLGLPLGVWALAVLFRSEVREAFVS
jgi:hypothetical protein